MPLLMAFANLAPLFSKYFGGNDSVVSKVVEGASAIATQITGASSPEEAIKMIGENQEMKEKFILATNQQSIEWDAMYLADVADARKRDAALAATGQHNFRADTMYFLAVVVIAVLVYAVLKSSLDEYAKGIITLVLGRFLGYLDGIYNFEFGTTRTSRNKDETINKLSGSGS